MIAAIADDLTGATEIAGLGWRHGLRADVLHRDEPVSEADLVVFDSDSRLCSEAEARRRVSRIARQLRERSPEWIFKKVDSVLRGNVLAEIETLLEVLKFSRCILAPANPTGGRVIRAGRYFIHGTPVNRTDFRQDPHHPRRSSRVLAMLGRARSFPVSCRLEHARLPERGIIVAEVERFRDALDWAGTVSGEVLAAGGGDFFHALLQSRGFTVRKHPRLPRPDPTLFVCGSLAKATTDFMERCRAKGWPVLLMPEGLRHSSRVPGASLSAWESEASAALENHARAVLGIGAPLLHGTLAPQRLASRLIAAVAHILARSTVRCVCVEGGATAAALSRAMGWTRLAVEHEFVRGVTGVRPHAQANLLMVCKPGSYLWPAGLEN